MMQVFRKLADMLFPTDEHLTPVSVTRHEVDRKCIYTVSWKSRGITHVYRFTDNWKDELQAKIQMRRDRKAGMFSAQQYEYAIVRLSKVQGGEHD